MYFHQSWLDHLQRVIDLRIHLLNYSLHSKTLSESLMRMEKNIASCMGDFNCNMLPANTTCSGVSHIGITDHSLIYVYRKISSPSVIKGTSTITYRQFKNFNRSSFPSDLTF